MVRQLEMNAAYLHHWLRVLRSDKGAIFRHAADAQLACDYLITRSDAGRAGEVGQFFAAKQHWVNRTHFAACGGVYECKFNEDRMSIYTLLRLTNTKAQPRLMCSPPQVRSIHSAPRSLKNRIAFAPSPA